SWPRGSSTAPSAAPRPDGGARCMETPPDRPSHTPAPLSPAPPSAPSVSSPSSPSAVMTLGTLLVQLSVIGSCVLLALRAVDAAVAGSPVAWKILAGLGGVVV